MDVNTDELEEYRDELDGLINGLKSLSECTKENVQELIDEGYTMEQIEHVIETVFLNMEEHTKITLEGKEDDIEKVLDDFKNEGIEYIETL